MKRRYLNRKTIFLISALVVGVDQLSKYWVQNQLIKTTSLLIIPHVLQFQLVKNTGAAFSLFSESTFLLGLLSLSVSIFLSIWIWRSSLLPFWQGMALAFLLGGSLGNGIDRWFLGYVIDFLEFVVVDFPVFNGADIAINLAVICFFIDTVKKKNGREHS